LIWRHSTAASTRSLHCCQPPHPHHEELRSSPVLSHHCILPPATVTARSSHACLTLALTSTARSETSLYTSRTVGPCGLRGPRDKNGPALAGTEYRLMPSACRLIVRAPATAVCVPGAHKTEKLEKPDETVCEPRRHSCQLAFSQPFALSSTCIYAAVRHLHYPGDCSNGIRASVPN